jgi:hypothetical protein
MRSVRMHVVVDGPGDARRQDESTRQLARDLRQVGGLSVTPLETAPAAGGKSGTVQHIGALVVSGVLSAAGLKAIGEVIVAYLARSGARQITLRDGDREVIVSGAAAADVAEVVRNIDKLLARPDDDR